MTQHYAISYRDLGEEHACPFSDKETNICSASLSSMIIGRQKNQVYCSSDNYDNCPMFISKILRKRG